MRVDTVLAGQAPILQTRPIDFLRRSAERPIDLVHLARQTMGDPELEREVLGLFLDQSLRLLRAVRAASCGVARTEVAHALKGSARAIGAAAVARAAERLEALGDEADEEALLEAVAAIHATVAEARAAIAGLLEGEFAH